MPSPNGILASVGGSYIAAGANSLPPASSTQPPDRVVALDVPGLGPVRITYRLDWYRHGRGKFWHWKAVSAERATE